MSLPVTLPANTISIYGASSTQGITTAAAGFQFGVVNQMYFGAQVDLTGQSVMFKNSNSIIIRYDNNPYYLIPEQDIIFTEESGEV